MDWYTFYNNFWDWSDATIRTNIYKLEDIEAEDLVDAVANIFDEKRANALVRRAIKLKVPVSEEMFQDLSGMISKQVAKELRDYCGLNKDYFLTMKKSLRIKQEAESPACLKYLLLLFLQAETRKKIQANVTVTAQTARHTMAIAMVDGITAMAMCMVVSVVETAVQRNGRNNKKY